MDQSLMIAIGCAFIAVIYGVVSISSVLKLSEGNDDMKRISKAIQEGASAYLKRQYTTISIVGVILFILIFVILKSPATAIGFMDGWDRLTAVKRTR